MHEYNLEPHQLIRPEKISWRIPGIQTPNVSALDLIKSKSQRKFLHTVDAILEENGITWELIPLSKQQFLDWLPYYESHMLELDFRILATETWYEARVQAGKEIWGMFFHQHGKLVCSGIFVMEGTEKATFAFKASDRIELTKKENSSIGSVIDYFFIKEMIHRGVKTISAGRSRNAFGVYNTFGYLEYKLRFGYEPLIAEEVSFEHSVPLSEDNSVVFFATHQEKLQLTYIHPEALQKEVPAVRLLPASLSFQEIII